MWTNKIKLWRYTLCILLTFGALAYTVKGDDEVPSETQCRPYIEKALKEHHVGDSELGSLEDNDSKEELLGDETNDKSDEENSTEVTDDDDNDTTNRNEDEDDDTQESKEDDGGELSVEVANEPYVGQVAIEESDAVNDDSKDEDDEQDHKEIEKNESDDNSAEDSNDENNDSLEDGDDSRDAVDGDSKEHPSADDDTAEQASDEDQEDSQEQSQDDESETDDAVENESDGKSQEADDQKSGENDEEGPSDTDEKSEETEENADQDSGVKEENEQTDDEDSGEVDKSVTDSETKESNDAKSNDEDQKSDEKGEISDTEEDTDEENVTKKEDQSEDAESDKSEDESAEGAPEEELLFEKEIPENLRSREHIVQILRLNEESSEAEITIEKAADIILRDLKKLYENNIKPLENLYKYRDLSNRHFGDPEIFSKPLVLFMGPWSGGKSTILNYLTGLEFTDWSLRSGAEPSPAYFNILMHGNEPEVLDGTQLAADWTFSGLQKFGQGLEERLRGLKYPSKLLEKVNIVEIPGILEVRKQVSRVFPFNDACQWFIDRADIIFLVYDPSKLDVGPETEAILDQLKGRESQTRIVLNKADSVKPEELLRVQSALIWNISPLMSSPQPPVMYTVSLWSLPYEPGAPARLLQAQEKELLKDLRTAVDRRIENKIASARRFAVRVRNHAKMVDCYLTTYYNHKTIFGNRKLISDSIIENPQNYHIYEGLSTLTNISRYDLPDPETYRDFFRLNPLYEFQQLSATCTYFKGCPINKLDVAIAYDLPDLVGKYKKMVETVTPQGMPQS